jgi:hypothetical protein
MRLARPPGGFRIQLSPNVRLLVEAECEKSPDFGSYWRDIVSRLSFTAHLEGVADARFGPGHRLWAASADPDRRLPRVKLVYLVLGDTVRIRVAHIG